MNKPFKITPQKINKGWGHELIIANLWSNYQPSDEVKQKGYCLKLLVFEKPSEGSMHFHAMKHEVFYVLEGHFRIRFIEPKNADVYMLHLKEGDAVVIPQNNPHKIICMDKGVIIEASTPDHPDDSYRVEKGDSQKLK